MNMEKVTPTQVAIDLLVIGALANITRLPPDAIRKLKLVLAKTKTCLTKEEHAIDVSPEQVLNYLVNKYEIE